MDGIAHIGAQQAIHELYVIEMSPVNPADRIIQEREAVVLLTHTVFFFKKGRGCL